MKAAHTREHEQLLAELLTGDRPRAEVEAALVACDECQGRLREFDTLVESMNATSRLERDVLAQERSESLVGGEDAVRRFFENQGPTRAARRWPLGAWVAVAASAAALFFVFILFRPFAPDDSGDGGGMLSPDSRIELVEPAQVVSEWTRFAWMADYPVGCRYQLRVKDAGTGEELWRGSRSTKLQWEPAPDEVRSWPDAITWEVRCYDATNAEIDFNSASSRRQP